MMDLGTLYEALRRQRGTILRVEDYPPQIVSDVAEETARLTGQEISHALGLKLTQAEWSQLEVIVRRRIAATIRHTVFDPVPFPVGDNTDPFQHCPT